MRIVVTRRHWFLRPDCFLGRKKTPTTFAWRTALLLGAVYAMSVPALAWSESLKALPPRTLSQAHPELSRASVTTRRPTALNPILGALPEPTSPSNALDQYILNAGDEINITDNMMGEITQGPTHIAADGAVDLPLLGNVVLAGLSVEQAQQTLNQRYQTYYVHPSLTIQLLAQHPIRVYIKGAVKTPGVYTSGSSSQTTGNGSTASLGETDRSQTVYQLYLTDALLQAGGLRHDANLRDIRIERRVSETAPPQTVRVDLWALLAQGAVGQDIPLQEQDVVIVPSVPPDALAQAGTSHSLDWKKLAQSNLSLNHFTINVLGSVQQPGAYSLGTNDTVLTALAQAGGLRADANPKDVYLLRANAAGQVFKKRIDVSALQRTKSQPHLSGSKALAAEPSTTILPAVAGQSSANSSSAKTPPASMAFKVADPWITLLPDDVIFVDDSQQKKWLHAGRIFLDKTTSAALLPFFNSMLMDK